MHELLYTLLNSLNIAIIGDSTDPMSTKRPDLILVFIYVFKLVIVAERFLKICFPFIIRLNNIYGIFFLSFINDVLNIIIKNINKYKAFYY